MEFPTTHLDPMADLLADPEFVEGHFATLIADYEANDSADGGDPAFRGDPVAESVTLAFEDLAAPGGPDMSLEDLVRYCRVAAARQDQWFHDLLSDAARDPDPWVGPDPTLDPLWTPPRDISISAVRARRRDLAVRAAAMDIAVRCRLSEHHVRNRAHRAQVLTARCPQLWAAYLAGDVSEHNAGTAATLVDTLPANAPETWAAFDTALTAAAARLTAGKFRSRARAIRERVHPESLEERHARAAKDRNVWVMPQLDGMASIEALLPGATGLAIEDRLDAESRHLAAQPGETRTLPQLRADIFADLLLSGGRPGAVADPADPEAEADVSGAADRGGDACSTLPSLKGIVATVRITIPALALLGITDETATLDGYGPIDIATARRLAGTATSWIRVLTDPVTGTVLTVDRRMYRVPADLRRWLETQHPTCVAPGCNRPSRRCDIDHRRRWADGGTTGADNLGPLCPPHHSVKDETLWAVARDPDSGALTWTSPTGCAVDADPPPF